VELPRGHYGSVALTLAETAEVKLADGTVAALQVRPQERVFKIPEFDFDDGREWAELRLTFDVSGSIRDFLAVSTADVVRFSPEVSVSSLAVGDRG
jgi:hypothetical protein